MLLLRRGDFVLETHSPVIKGEDYARVVEAGRIVEEAQAYARELKERAEAEFEQRRAEGYQEGLNEAREEMALQMFEMVDRSAAYLEHIEDEVIKIVVNCLKQILATMPADEVIVQTVRKVLGSVMANQKQLVLRVPFEQAETVGGRVQEILASFPGLMSIEVVPDQRLSGTDCILETDVGVVEAGADVQIRAIERVMRKNLRQSK